ncbi:tektin-3 isoform X2 [Eupeodes corollae]|uniref:tektin-3 isoform X2 n=1 Tax=Eupeodes corollae TaxID=290404 RepID=UPI00249215B0|nr:tektin-3 isoform X2 [Eupeodes corollae]
MLCWKNEDLYLQKRYPVFASIENPRTLKQILLKSSIPIPWSTAGGPSCMEPSVPRGGSSLQSTRPHPWRPTLAYDMVEVNPVAEQPITNQLVKPCFTPAGMSTEPLTFPNLVTGFERNPQHAARAALYTRYTPGEWTNNCLAKYAESNANRNQSERLRNEAIRIMRETDEKTAQGQRDAGRRLGERLTDVTFWKNELNTELEKVVFETNSLANYKSIITKAIQDLETPLHIAQECLYHREGRQEIEKVHDHVEKSLLMEVSNLRACQEKLRNLYDMVMNQLQELRGAQYLLEDDVAHKESTLGIDSVCHQLNNYSRGISYYGGVEKYDPTISTQESWSQCSSQRVNKSQTERAKSTQLRSDIETIINQTANNVWDCWGNSNNALDRRSQEMSEAKSKVQLHLFKVQQELFDLEKHIALLQKAIQDKSHPLKVAQTRLEARTHREGVELCKDFAQMRLVQEVHDLQDIVSNLHRKLQEAESQHQQLLKTRVSLEADLRRKVNALFIDREKCMGMRRSFPVDNLIKY